MMWLLIAISAPVYVIGWIVVVRYLHRAFRRTRIALLCRYKGHDWKYGKFVHLHANLCGSEEITRKDGELIICARCGCFQTRGVK